MRLTQEIQKLYAKSLVTNQIWRRKINKGRTAIFAAAESYGSAKDEDRMECVHLLVDAGTDVNARDKDGNTPLHETFVPLVEEELLRIGADVNARNNEGETPIFNTFDDSAISLFIQNGADLTIRNEKGQTVIEAAKGKGQTREDALNKAIQEWNQRNGH